MQCGAKADIDLFGIGAGAMLGVYVNLLEFVAELDSDASCGLQTTEWFDLNVGAFAELDVEVDYKSKSVVPSVSTTLFNSPKYTQCWDNPSSAQSGAPTAPASSTIDIAESAPITTTTHLAMGGVTVLSSFSSKVLPTSVPSSATNTSSVGNVHITPTTENIVTSTIYSTTEYTVIRCAATVVNCPASYQSSIVVTQTVDSFTTVCPLGATVTMPSRAVSSPLLSATIKVVTTPINVIKEAVTLTRISPILQTFVPPSDVDKTLQSTLTSTESGFAVITTAPATASSIVGGYGNVTVQQAPDSNGTTTRLARTASSVKTYTSTNTRPASTVVTSMPVSAGHSLSGLGKSLGLVVFAGLITAFS